MINGLTCPRCQSKFYSAYQKPRMNCPYCGLSFEIPNHGRRKSRRSMVRKDCSLRKDHGKFEAQAMDISSTGLGIRLSGRAPFIKNDTLSVVIGDFDIELIAQVVWVNFFYENNFSRAGLRFCYT